MKIEAITLREISMRLKAPFETSFGKVVDRRILLVQLHADGVCGWGEVTVTEGPFYNPESTDISWIVLSKFIVPMVLGKTLHRAQDVRTLLSPIRGHEMSKAAVENALWDIEAQQKQVPLSRLLGGKYSEVASGVSLGIQLDSGRLISQISQELDAGYQRIKLKIKPDWDLKVISAVRIAFPEVKLMVDANSSYRIDQVSLLKGFDDFGLMMIEQPLAWDDIYEHSLLQPQLQTPLCLDECIHSVRDAVAAIEMGACRIINIKLGRVGGHSEAKKMQEFCLARSVPAWSGGMLESGIGRAHNVAMSALPGFVLPGDVSASQRYWHEDIIDPEIEVSRKGTIRVPDGHGLGYTVRTQRIEQLTCRRESWNATPVINAAGLETTMD
jgi:o-succinylbenzoate synthase